MKQRIVIAISLIIFIFGQGFAEEDPIEFFKTLRRKTFATLPAEFSGMVTSKTIEKKLKTIPNDYVVKGKSAYVLLTFSKTNGVKIEVKNVDPLYTDMFQQYVRFFTLGPMLSTKSDDAVLRKYEFKFSETSGNLIMLRLRIKNAANNFIIYTDTLKYKIGRVDYLMEDEILSSTIIQYNAKKKGNKTYRVPVKFIVKIMGGDARPDYFAISNIKIK